MCIWKHTATKGFTILGINIYLMKFTHKLKLKHKGNCLLLFIYQINRSHSGVKKDFLETWYLKFSTNIVGFAGDTEGSTAEVDDMLDVFITT